MEMNDLARATREMVDAEIHKLYETTTKQHGRACADRDKYRIQNILVLFAGNTRSPNTHLCRNYHQTRATSRVHSIQK